MITLLGSPRRCCDGVTRRETLKAGALSLLGGGFTLENLLRAEERRPADRRPGKAKSVIVLYLLGGAATQDMWDLKPNAPVGIKSAFNPIATSAPGVQICEHLPQMAKWMHKAALVRSVNHKGGCHNPLGSYTGYEGSLANDQKALPSHPPSMGSVCEYLRHQSASAARGSDDDFPDYVCMPNWPGRFFGNSFRYSGPYAGFLGPRYDPLCTECAPYADGPSGDFKPTTVRGRPSLGDSMLVADMTVDRLQKRQGLLQQIDAQLRQVEGQQVLASHDRMQQRAFSVLTSTKMRSAFDLSKEDPGLLDRYGRTLFGHSALIARRLVQAGVRFVNVTWDYYRQAGDPNAWDTHANNFSILKNNHLPGLDQTYTALLQDLDRSGLLDETLVVVMSDMGRTPDVNDRAGRDHWTACYSVLLAGAGIKGGTVCGLSDSRAAYVKDRPVRPADICATIYHCLGIDPAMMVHDRSGRPIPVAHGGAPIGEIVG